MWSLGNAKKSTEDSVGRPTECAKLRELWGWSFLARTGPTWLHVSMHVDVLIFKHQAVEGVLYTIKPKLILLSTSWYPDSRLNDAIYCCWKWHCSPFHLDLLIAMAIAAGRDQVPCARRWGGRGGGVPWGAFVWYLGSSKNGGIRVTGWYRQPPTWPLRLARRACTYHHVLFLVIGAFLLSRRGVLAPVLSIGQGSEVQEVEEKIKGSKVFLLSKEYPGIGWRLLLFFGNLPLVHPPFLGNLSGRPEDLYFLGGHWFIQRYCPFCQRAKSILSSVGVAVEVLELADMNKRPLVKDPAAIMDYMEKITGARTVPRLFIAGKFVGGCDQVLVVLLLHVAFVFPAVCLSFEVEVLQSFPG